LCDCLLIRGGVDDDESVRLIARPLEIGAANTLEELAALLLDPIA